MFPHEIAPSRISDFAASAASLGSFFLECGGSPPLLRPKLYLNILVRAPRVGASAPEETLCSYHQQSTEHRRTSQSICTVGPPVVPANSASRATIAFVMRYKLCAAGAVSPCAATGLPVSPPTRIRGSISISPSTGTPYS